MTIRRLVLTGATVFSVALAGALGYVASIVRSGTGYEAQTMCSAVFISGRDPAGVVAAEFGGLHPLLKLIHPKVDRERREVRASLAGLGRQKSVFRPGLGCTLVDADAEIAPAPAALLAPRPPVNDAIEQGAGPLPIGTDRARLAAAVDRAFAEPDPSHPRNTRALLMVKDGRLIVERYAPGFSKEMPLAGYSLTKTWTGALAGILVGRGLLNPSAPAPIPLWRTPGDPRAGITVEHLLHMTTGTRWSDDADDPRSPVLLMMYHERDMAAFAAREPVEHAPGAHFAYNSGSTNLLSRALLSALHGDRAAYLALPRTALFEPAGMRSAVLAPDAAGTLIGNTQGFATARDWARFGELYLHDGARNGVQVLPKGWVAYSGQPRPATQARGYGAQVWINKGLSGHPERRPRPTLPEDTLLMNGQFGQLTAVVPSLGVVIVRLGETHGWDFSRDPDQLVASLLAAFPEPQS